MRRPPFALALALGLAGLALFETAQALYRPARVPSAADWTAAATTVRAGLQPDDLIVFAPRWVDQIGRMYLGDRIPVEMAARADARRYRRIWEVALRGAQSPEAKQGRRLSETRHGQLRVSLYEQTPVHILADLTSLAAEARVTQLRPGQEDETPCLHDGSGYRCAGTRVEQRTLEIDYAPRRGLLVPVAGGRVTRIEFPEVLLGRVLVGYTGLHDYYARKSSAAPVDFRVLIDGRERLQVQHGNADGWRRFEIDTAAEAGGRHAVRFEISAAAPAWRNLGFHAETWK